MFTLPMIYRCRSKKLTNNFKFKNCSFGKTDIAKNSDKEKYVYSGYGITFDSAG